MSPKEEVEIVSELAESLSDRQTELLILVIDMCVREGAPKGSLGALYATAYTRQVKITPEIIARAKELERG